MCLRILQYTKNHISQNQIQLLLSTEKCAYFTCSRHLVCFRIQKAEAALERFYTNSFNFCVIFSHFTLDLLCFKNFYECTKAYVWRMGKWHEKSGENKLSGEVKPSAWSLRKCSIMQQKDKTIVWGSCSSFSPGLRAVAIASQISLFICG